MAEAARKRLAVLDHATHYTSTTCAAEPRVVDHGHGGDHGHGAGVGRRQMSLTAPSVLAMERVASRRPERIAPRAPQGTAGVSRPRRRGRGLVRAPSMYEERLGADASGVSGTGPKPKPRVGRLGEVETKLGEVSAFLKRTELGEAGRPMGRRAPTARIVARRARLARKRDPDATRNARSQAADVRQGGGRPRRGRPASAATRACDPRRGEPCGRFRRRVGGARARRRGGRRTPSTRRDASDRPGRRERPAGVERRALRPRGDAAGRGARSPRRRARDARDATRVAADRRARFVGRRLGETPDLGDENALAFRGTPSFAPDEDRHDDDSHPTWVAPFRVETLAACSARARRGSTASRWPRLKDRDRVGCHGSRAEPGRRRDVGFQKPRHERTLDDRSRHERTLVVRRRGRDDPRRAPRIAQSAALRVFRRGGA